MTSLIENLLGNVHTIIVCSENWVKIMVISIRTRLVLSSPLDFGPFLCLSRLHLIGFELIGGSPLLRVRRIRAEMLDHRVFSDALPHVVNLGVQVGVVCLNLLLGVQASVLALPLSQGASCRVVVV